MNTSSAFDEYKVSVDEFYKLAASKPEHERLELINGEIFDLSSPNTLHQRISLLLSVEFSHYFENKKCDVLAAPMDVILFESDENIDPSIVQPDLLVFCDKKQDDGNRIHGAPSLVIEIWSDSNNEKYRRHKISLYKQAGVREIWEIFPGDCITKVTTLVDNSYNKRVFDFSEKVSSLLFQELVVDLSKFDEI